MSKLIMESYLDIIKAKSDVWYIVTSLSRQKLSPGQTGRRNLQHNTQLSPWMSLRLAKHTPQ